MRVLIAEDDPVSRLILTATLRKWGQDPVVTHNGMEALSYFEKDAPPEFAILDWMMPELDGPEVCRRIRAKLPTTPIYIILLTAKTQREDLVVGLAAGADDYVTKPFDQQELYARFQVGLRVVDLQRRLATQVRELCIAMSRLRVMQQAQKLEALGQMSSGIAHEINTPIQYIGENIRFLRESWAQIHPVLEREHDSDVEYLVKEVPKALEESLHGVQKVSTLVRAMRDFSRPSGENKVAADINRVVETAITVATSHWRYVAEMETQLGADIPTALCFPSEIHQVLFNLIVNAGDAIADAGKSGGNLGKIRITTSADNGFVEIRVSDTGCGIREEYRSRIFESFFTTKDVGRGTGQGLAIAYSIIVQRHNGDISFETEPGRGTTFLVRIPTDGIGRSEHERKEADSLR